jgi:tetratricopeptide (TPR) repeat protein
METQGGSPELRSRVLMTLAYQQAETGDYTSAMSSLDAAEQADPNSIAMATANRAVLLHKLGRSQESERQFEQALELLDGNESLDLVATLMNRGNLYMSTGKIEKALSDTRRAYEVSQAAGYQQVEFMALHNLGWVQYLAGDLPSALDLMARASRRVPESAQGVPALDRARVLTAAGMFSEAKEAVDRALATFALQRAQTELVDALLASGELALLRGDQITAKRQARRAESISRRHGHASADLLAQLLGLRADAVAFDPVRSSRITPPTKATLRAAVSHAGQLANQLNDAGLIEDARTARLVLADARLLLGDLAGAQAASEQAGIGNRKPNLGIRMHHSLVKARISLASGSRKDALAEIARGLDDLGTFMARFGSQDMQAAASVHGGALARTGLRTALETGEPSVILPWLERSRAATTRLPAIRPPNDPQLVEELAKLRVAVRAARAATLAGKTDRALEREIVERRARIRARTWTTGGAKGKAQRPITMTGVQRHLREHESDTTVLAYFRGQGKVHALVVTARRSGYRVLEDRAVVERRLARISADLDLLAAPRIGAPVRAVATKSLNSGLKSLSDLLIEPVGDLLGPGKVRIAVVGRLGTAPWGLLPGLSGRPVSVTPSITSALVLPTRRSVARSWPGFRRAACCTSPRTVTTSRRARCSRPSCSPTARSSAMTSRPTRPCRRTSCCRRATSASRPTSPAGNLWVWPRRYSAVGCVPWWPGSAGSMTALPRPS